MRPSINTLTRTSVVACSIALALLATPATAQDDTNCTLPPLTLPLFDATPAAIVAATPATSSGANEVDEQEIAAAIDTIVACANESNPAFAYAIFTERYLAEQYADPTQTYLPAFEQFIAVGQTGVEEAFELESLSIVSVLEDGRVVVVVETSSPTMTFTDAFTLANIDGVWLIDDAETSEGLLSRNFATPTVDLRRAL